ncbi:S8 family peptidase [Bacillus bingmayongensis]|uniref:S8 family peptidase n=1 Tax=Bacillus bingmayongensis TaxID=1150157 RepID=UPI00030044F7|nr:S8 family peptidase [Bacillus bingmayongensis]MBY0598811.1 S8 family peptidase [Bacillus bingmayongensis]
MYEKNIYISLILICITFSPVQSLASNKEDETNYLITFKEKVDPKLIEEYTGIMKEAYFENIANVQISKSKIKELIQNPKIKSIEINQNVKALEQKNDWGIDSLNILSIKNNTGLTGKNISIAILDTGVDMNHADINIRRSITFIEGTNGYADESDHGTHISGIIGAKDNSIGVVGIAPSSKIYSLKVLDKKENGKYSNIIQAIEWSIKNNIRIISMSFGGYQKSDALESAINKAHEKNIILVASAGNTGFFNEDTITYPAKYKNVISVGAVNKQKQRWFASSQGNKIDIMAPGEKILSTSPKQKYTIKSGTSMAAAYVTGSISLLLEKKPQLTNIEVENILKKTTTPIGISFEYGNGILNIEKAVNEIN